MNLFENQSYRDNLLYPSQCGFNRILSFLKNADGDFSTKLSLRVDLQEYSEKLALKAFNLFFSYLNNDIAHAAFYFNEKDSQIFITSIAIIDEYRGRGFGKKMLNEIEIFALFKGVELLELEADCSSNKILNFYSEFGFELDSKINDDVCILRKYLNKI